MHWSFKAVTCPFLKENTEGTSVGLWQPLEVDSELWGNPTRNPLVTTLRLPAVDQVRWVRSVNTTFSITTGLVRWAWTSKCPWAFNTELVQTYRRKWMNYVDWRTIIINPVTLCGNESQPFCLKYLGSLVGWGQGPGVYLVEWGGGDHYPLLHMY